MLIERIDVYRLGLPLRSRLFGPAARFDSLETVVVRMQSGSASGWGEASPGNAPLGGPEWAAGVFDCLRDWLAPAVCGSSIESAEHLEERLAGFQGNRFAKAALDTAWWDLKARLENQPLHRVLGAVREKVEVGRTLDRMDSHEQFLSTIQQLFDAGYARLKLKFRPGWAVEMVHAVRVDFPTQTIHVDIEAGLNLGHFEMLCRLDDFGLAMIEQPLPADDLVGHAMLQESVQSPVCLDESITTVSQAEMALELKSCRYVNLKPGRVGGLTAALRIHELCRAAEVPCFAGAPPQSAIGSRHALALAAKENCTYPADYFPAHEVLECDLAEPLLPQRDPQDNLLRIGLWDGPGIGIEPDADCLEKHSLAQATIEP